MFDSRDACHWYQSNDLDWELAQAQYGDMSDAEINYRAEMAEGVSDSLTEREAAALLGVTVTHVRRLVVQGALHRRDSGPDQRGERGRSVHPTLDRADVERYARERRPRGRPGKGAEQ